MKVAIINYGMGNLGSVRRALAELHAEAFIADHPGALWDAQHIVLPGVGSFAEGSARLHADGWDEALRKQVIEHRKPILGICLGMQLLASQGEEGGSSRGLNLIPGKVARLDTLGCRERVPHAGWNDVEVVSTHPLFAHIGNETDFYFVHSYVFCAQPEHVLATCKYGVSFAAAVGEGHVFGTQFHPEKSSKAGHRLLRNFLEYGSC